MTTARRVLHLVPALFGSDGVVGGAERYALGLARAMADVAPTTLLTFGPAARELAFGRLRVRVLKRTWAVRGQDTNPLSVALPRALLVADVIHCHQRHVLASSLAAVVGRLSGRPVFVTDLGGGGWDVSAYVRTDRWFTGHLHISRYSRAVAGHDGQPWATVILGGVDPLVFAPDPSARRDGPVLFVGRILPHKGVDVLVEAAPPELPVEVIGPATDPGYLADLVAMARGKAVRFRHDCDDRSLVEAYRRAACVVLPSVYRTRYGAETRIPELLGQTVLEAMAAAAPVVATRVASLPEIVADGVTGFLVPPNEPGALREKLLWLRDHPAEAAEMGAAGRARVLAHFTWEQVVARCLDAYAAGDA